MSLTEIKQFVDDGYIGKLINTEDDKFLWTDDTFKQWYDQRDAEVGDTFVDGNNGDTHVVHYVNLDNQRIVVENTDQREGLYELWYWEGR